MAALRSPQPAEIPALVEFWNRSATFSPVDRALLEEKLWGDPDYRPELTLVVGPPERPGGLAMGVVRGAGENAVGYVKLLATAPERRRRGLGARLLAALESAFTGGAVPRIRIAESAPNYLAPGVDARYEDGLRFFRHHGYRDVGEACNLQVDLQADVFDTRNEERRLADRGVSVRRAAAADWPALQALLATFGGSWRQEVRCSMDHSPPAVQLAWRDGELLAFAASGGNNASAAWFGPMGTAPAARGLGIGAVLLRRCLRDLQRLGFAAAVIPWVGPVGFYEKHAGARFLSRFQRLEKTPDGDTTQERHAS